MADRYAHAIFCDDVREESNGKQIFVGVYGGSMNVPKLPGKLRRINAVIYFGSPTDQPVSSLRVSICRDDEEINGADIPSDALSVFKEGDEESSEHPLLIKGQVVIVAADISFDSERWLIAKITIDGEEIEAGRLLVREKRKQEE